MCSTEEYCVACRHDGRSPALPTPPFCRRRAGKSRSRGGVDLARGSQSATQWLKFQRQGSAGVDASPRAMPRPPGQKAITPSVGPRANTMNRYYSLENSMHGSGFPQCLPAPNLMCELPAGIVSDNPFNFEPTNKGALSIRSSLT